MSKEEFCENFLEEFRKYFHYQTEVSIIKTKKGNRTKNIVQVKDPQLEKYPAFFIDGYYQKYKKGFDIESIARYCYRGFLSMASSNVMDEKKFLFIWKCAKDVVTFRVMGLFEQDPYNYLAKLDWHGLSIAFQLELPGYTVDVTQKTLESWNAGIGESLNSTECNVDIQTLFKHAKENTRKKYMPEFLSGSEREAIFPQENDKLLSSIHTLFETDENGNPAEGLRCLLYDDLLKDIAEEIGDFYVFPCSLSCAFLLTDSGLALDKRQMLQELVKYTGDLPPEVKAPAVVLRYDSKRNALCRVI